MQYRNVSVQSKYVYGRDLIKGCLGTESKLLNSAESKSGITLLLCKKEGEIKRAEIESEGERR